MELSPNTSNGWPPADAANFATRHYLRFEYCISKQPTLKISKKCGVRDYGRIQPITTEREATTRRCNRANRTGRTPENGRAAVPIRAGNSSGSRRGLSKRIGYVRGFARFPATRPAHRSPRAWRCRRAHPKTPVRGGSRCAARQSKPSAARFRYIRRQICATAPASGLCLADRARRAHQGSAHRRRFSKSAARNPARSRYSHGRFWSETHAATAKGSYGPFLAEEFQVLCIQTR
jgi:hypothetical protein